MRAYRFRLYLSKAQEEQMRHHLWVSKELWNNLLEAVKKEYEVSGKFLNRNQLQLLVKNSELYSQAAQGVAHRLGRALRRIGQMRKLDKKAGFPRFKNFDKLKSLLYPQSGFKLIGRKLKVTPFGELNVKLHRRVEGIVKQLVLKRESSGKWFAVFLAEELAVEPQVNFGPPVGLDLGVMNLATLSDGLVVANPRQFKQLEPKLAKVQRDLSCKKKGSRNCRRAKLRVARVHEEITNARKDYLHKQANFLLSRYSLIAMEELGIQKMVEGSYLAKGINDASMGMLTNFLSYKAANAGSRIVFVNPKNTSKECSGCHAMASKSLWQRVHNCRECGLVLDRDVNAAINILAKATSGNGVSKACEVGLTCSTMMQEAPCES